MAASSTGSGWISHLTTGLSIAKTLILLLKSQRQMIVIWRIMTSHQIQCPKLVVCMQFSSINWNKIRVNWIKIYKRIVIQTLAPKKCPKFCHRELCRVLRSLIQPQIKNSMTTTITIRTQPCQERRVHQCRVVKLLMLKIYQVETIKMAKNRIILRIDNRQVAQIWRVMTTQISW